MATTFTYKITKLKRKLDSGEVSTVEFDITGTDGDHTHTKSTSIEPTRNYQQSPVVIVSENFDCVNEVITLIFEEKINISYVLIKTSKNYETYNQIKSINIKAY